MITRVEIENWKSHRQSEFEFGKGTNVLVGVLGSGKSSVMDAICYALYGTFPALNAKRLGSDEILMAKPSEMDYARVGVEFEYGGKGYRVERNIYRGKRVNDGKLYCDGRLIAGPKTTSVNEKVSEVLDMSYDLFARAVYSEQNQIDYFLRLSASERKEKIDELLGINKYEKVRGNSVSVANRLLKTAEDRKKLLGEQKKAQSAGEEKALRERLEEKEEERKRILRSVGEMDARVARMRERLKEGEKKEELFNEFRDSKIRIKAGIDEMGKTIARIREDLGGKKAAEIKIMAEVLKEREKGIGKKLNEAEKRIEKLQEEMGKVENERSVNESMANERKKILLQLKSAKALCPVCRAELEDEARERLICGNEDEIEVFEKKNHEAGVKADEIGAEIRKARAEKSSYEEEKENMVAEAEKLKRLLKDAESIEDFTREKNGLENELAGIEKQVEKLGFDGRLLKKEREEVAKEEERAKAFKRELESSKEIIDSIRQSIESLERAKRQIDELEESVRHVESMVEKLNIFTNALKSTQSELREAMIGAINLAMDDIWPRVYPYEDYLSAKIVVEEGNYEIKAMDRKGSWIRVEGILSGGERSAVAITIRIALSLVLAQNLGWLILDEPTHNLDSLAVSELSLMMKEHLPELVEQIFIITHDKEMEKAASSHLYMLERDKKADGITIPVAEPLG